MIAAKYKAEDKLKVTLMSTGTNNNNGLSILLSTKIFSCDVLSLVRYSIANSIYPMEAIVNNYGIPIDVDNTWFYIVKDVDTGEETIIWDAIIDHDKTTYLREIYEFVVTIKDTSGNRAKTMIDEVVSSLTTGISQVIIDVQYKDPTIMDPLAVLKEESRMLKEVLQTQKDLEIVNLPTLDIKKNMDAINNTLADVTKSISTLAARANIENIG